MKIPHWRRVLALPAAPPKPRAVKPPLPSWEPKRRKVPVAKEAQGGRLF